MYTIRIDDVSLNTDMLKLEQMVALLNQVFGSRVQLMFGVTPAVFDMSHESGLQRERAFPRKLNAYSDHRMFYGVQRIGLPEGLDRFNATVAGHGLVHVDHRLLNRQAQEISILTSCSIINSKIFIPPFNKHNQDTVEICQEFGIHLVRFEAENWRHLVHEPFHLNHPRYYFHTHDFTYEQLSDKLLSRIG